MIVCIRYNLALFWIGVNTNLVPTRLAIRTMLTVKPNFLEDRDDGRDEHLSHGDKACCIQIRLYLAGHDPRVCERTWFVMLHSEVFQAVVDESGYGAADPNDTFIFAGYIAKVADWENFTHAWDAIFSKHPELGDADYVKQLARWTGSKSDNRMITLMKIITGDPRFGSIRWRLPYAAYRAANVTHVLSGDDALYTVAWLGVLFGSLAAIHGIPNAKLRFFYDKNIEQEPKVQAGFQELRKWAAKYRPDVLAMLPSRPVPEDDQMFWALRAADALAWNTHRQAQHRSFSNPLSRLVECGAVAYDETWTADDVREILVPNAATLHRLFAARPSKSLL